MVMALMAPGQPCTTRARFFARCEEKQILRWHALRMTCHSERGAAERGSYFLVAAVSLGPFIASWSPIAENEISFSRVQSDLSWAAYLARVLESTRGLPA